MGIVVDVVVIAILILSTFLGYKKGLVKVAFNIFAFLIAIVATFILYKPVSNIVISNTGIHDKIKNTIIEKYGETENEQKDTNTGLTAYITQTIEEMANETKETAVQIVANDISLKVIQVVIGIALFIVIRIALILLKFLSETLANLPFIKQANEAGGAIYGLLRGVLIVYILLNLLFIVVSINNNGKIQEAIDNSYIAKFVYENNLVIK